jgi:hypothetical protein
MTLGWLRLASCGSTKIREAEWDPDGERVIRRLDKILTKYTGKPGPHALRYRAIDEKRVLFI